MKPMVKAFIALQLFGTLSYFFLLLTAFLSANVKRYATWHSFCISWIISTASYALTIGINVDDAELGALGKSGGELARQGPGERICLTQAALIYASPTLTAMTTLAMCLHVLISIRAALKGVLITINNTLVSVLVIAPYAFFIIMLAVLIVLGNAKPDAVRMSPFGYYCHLEWPEPVMVCSAIAVAALIGVIIIETWMSRAVYRHRRTLLQTVHPMAFTVRVLVFGIVVVFTLVLGLLFLVPATRNIGVNFTLALIPLFGIIIFGSQNDILRVVIFWKKNWAQTSQRSQISSSRIRTRSLTASRSRIVPSINVEFFDDGLVSEVQQVRNAGSRKTMSGSINGLQSLEDVCAPNFNPVAPWNLSVPALALLSVPNERLTRANK
ncbi:hypothetical protein GYMLUDRAFT_932423 [Collybiopsis luxurians FD-317 M1]|nr:hypothetical protein GYMLUDRAFT_932423 [Collybiopsis luxurians FD-317 M1]